MYSYDPAGQLLTEGGLWPDDTVTYTYNNRLRTAMTLPAPNAAAWEVAYAYDAARRLTNITSPAGAFAYVLGIQAPASPLVSQLLLPNGAWITNAYDNVARLLSTKLKNSGGTTLDSQAYLYNQANQRIGETNLPGDYRNYTYDNSGQLLTAIGKESGGTPSRLQEQFGYNYDPAGNLNFRTNNALVQAFNVNAANELSTETNAGTLTVAGTTTSAATNVAVNGSTANLYGDATFALGGCAFTNGNNTFAAIAKDSYARKSTNSITCYLPATNNYTYDANGNLLSDGTRNFAYDDENQLIAVWVTNAWQSTYIYDGKMRRRIRKEYTWSGGAWIETNEVHYIYDENLPIQERDINNLPQVTYTRGNDLSGTLQGAGGISGLLARTLNSALLDPSLASIAHTFYHADGNGNITALISAGQSLVAKYLYDPFGNIISQSGSLADANLYRFSSKEFHPNSGLVYYGYRFYDPSLQRWNNRDPLEEIGGLNLYAFVENRALNDVDFFGFKGTNGLSNVLGSVGDWMKKEGNCLKQMCKDRMSKPVGKRGALPGSALGGAATTAGGGVVQVGTGVLQAGPGATAIIGIENACAECKRCRKQIYECGSPEDKACDAACDYCEKYKDHMQGPVHHL